MTLTVPRGELSGFSICPYAKQALSNNSYDILTGTVSSIHDILKNVDTEKYQVTIVIVSDYETYDIDIMREYTQKLNAYYKHNDLVILDNDPRDPFVINGVTTTFNDWYLWVIQSLSDLNEKHQNLSKTSYYKVWTQQQLDEVVNWRKTNK